MYLNLSESIRYVTKLPSVEAYEVGNFSPPNYKIEHPEVKSYSISKLLRDISHGEAYIPFSKPEEKTEKVEVKKNNHVNSESGDRETVNADDASDDLKKELEHKFDMLFGAFDSDNE